MMFEILGIEKVDYDSRKTGRRVQGTNLHCIVGEPSDRCQGQRVERLYVKQDIDCSSLAVGDRIEVFYNRYGSVDSVRLAG